MSTGEPRVLSELAEVRGQLMVITQMIQQNHQATNQRIEDLRHSIDGRFAGVDGRIAALERNERDTALRAAGTGALAGTVSAAIVAAAIKTFSGG